VARARRRVPGLALKAGDNRGSNASLVLWRRPEASGKVSNYGKAGGEQGLESARKQRTRETILLQAVMPGLRTHGIHQRPSRTLDGHPQLLKIRLVIGAARSSTLLPYWQLPSDASTVRPSGRLSPSEVGMIFLWLSRVSFWRPLCWRWTAHEAVRCVG